MTAGSRIVSSVKYELVFTPIVALPLLAATPFLTLIN